MGKLFSNFKACQTCRYWTGARDINGSSKLIDALSEKGKCVNKHSFFNQEMTAHACCQHHEPII